MRSAARCFPRWQFRGLLALLVCGSSDLLSADLKPSYHSAAQVVRGARMLAGPDATLESGSIVIRNGVIEAIGPSDKVEVPYDAEVIEGKGLVVYPGFLDLYTTLAQPQGVVRSQSGSGRTVDFAE